MTCPNCNSQYNDNLTSCPFCGAQNAYASAPPQQPFAQPQQPFAQPQQPFAQPQQSFAQPQQSFAQPQQPFAQPQQSPFQAPQGAFVAPTAPVKKKKSGGKIALILILAFMVLGVIGIIIGGNPDETAPAAGTSTFVKEHNFTDYTYTEKVDVTYEVDTVTNIIYTDTYEFNDDVDEQTIQIFYNDYKTDKYDKYSFIDYNVELDGSVITVTCTINDASDHCGDLVVLGFLDGYCDSISYTQTKRNLEAIGLELVED